MFSHDPEQILNRTILCSGMSKGENHFWGSFGGGGPPLTVPQGVKRGACCRAGGAQPAAGYLFKTLKMVEISTQGVCLLVECLGG